MSDRGGRESDTGSGGGWKLGVVPQFGVAAGAIMGYSQEGHITAAQGLIRGIQVHCVHTNFTFWMFCLLSSLSQEFSGQLLLEIQTVEIQI